MVLTLATLGLMVNKTPMLVDLEYAAFYVVKEDVEYDAVKSTSELVKYTSKVVTVSMLVDE